MVWFEHRLDESASQRVDAAIQLGRIVACLLAVIAVLLLFLLLSRLRATPGVMCGCCGGCGGKKAR